uniref:HTH psq-type domain-containing protein n=1 Tax=Branchiostoma floridae TaxID=7739 RepID=C3YIT1_BRAFL|eukprot:XP_002603794.1 hypothetical protein BRAFLDRAFT_86625 [Branchiostoma floridae]
METDPRSRERKSWPPDLISEVLRDIEDNNLSTSAAAKKYGIPRSTLVEKRSGKSAIDATNGRPNVMTKEEEETVKKYTEYRNQAGHPIDRTTVLSIATAVHRKYCEANGVEPKFDLNKGPSNNWWLSFKKRQGMLLRKPDPLDRARKDAIDESTINDFFTKYKAVMEKYGLTNAPHRIYNADETGFSLDPQKKKIVTFKSLSGAAPSVRPGSRDHITVLECASADGNAIPPLIIFSKNFPSSAYKLDGPPNALYASTSSGFIEAPVFLNWLKSGFHRFASQERPVLLLADQHSTHITFEVLEFAITHDIIILTFPPHATHILQPLDAKAGPFLAMKTKFTTVIHHLTVAKPNFYVTKTSFPRIYRTVREEALTMAAVRRGFKKTGIFPVNPDELDRRWLKMNELPGATTGATTGEIEENIKARDLLPVELDVLQLAEIAAAQEPPRPDGKRNNKVRSETGRKLLDIEEEMLQLAEAEVAADAAAHQTTAIKKKPPPVKSQSTCPTCGASKAPQENALVASGIVPKYMADILTPIPPSRARNNRRIKPRAIVFDEAYVATLKEEAEAKENEKMRQQELRKVQREEKKRKAEEEKARKRMEREEKKRKREEKNTKSKKNAVQPVASTSTCPDTEEDEGEEAEVTEGEAFPPENRAELEGRKRRRVKKRMDCYDYDF